MVSSAYLMLKKFQPYKQRLLTLMATVHPEKAVSAKTAFSFARCTPKGYLRNARIYAKHRGSTTDDHQIAS